MTNIKDFQQAKIDKEQLTVEEIIGGMFSNNCDKNRPYLGQQPKRASMKIEGLTRRDIQDCMVLGILQCKDPDKYEKLPTIYVSEEGNKYKSWEEFLDSGEEYSNDYIDPERVTWDDLYGWNLEEMDPIAAVRNMACHLECRLGIYPALLDGKLTVED